MDQNPQPSTPPMPDTAVPPGSAPPPAESTPPAGEGPPLAPPIDRATPEPAGPPADQWLPALSDEEWGELAQDARMDVAELKSVFSPAREVSHTFGGAELEALLNSDDEVFGSLGNDPDLIRGLGSFGEQLRVYTKSESELIRELTAFSQEAGQSFIPPKIPPLQGAALDAAIDQLLSRHMPNTRARQAHEAAGIFRHPAVRGMLERMVRQEHRALQSLRAMDAQRRQLSEEDRMMQNQPSTHRPQASREELALQSDELWIAWREASEAGDMMRADLYKRKLAEVDRRRFGG